MVKPSCTELLHSQYFTLVACFMKIFRDSALYIPRIDVGCLIVREINRSRWKNLSDAFKTCSDRLMIHLMSKCCTSLLQCSCLDSGTHPIILAFIKAFVNLGISKSVLNISDGFPKVWICKIFQNGDNFSSYYQLCAWHSTNAFGNMHSSQK